MIGWNETPKLLPLALGALLVLSGCEDRSSSSATPKSGAQVDAPTPAASAVTALQQENEQLKAQVATLKDQVADLEQTPQVLLERVQAAVRAEDLAAAQASAAKLEQRYGADGQAKPAKAAIAKLEAQLAARKEQAQLLEAKGFYALKPSSAAAVDGFVIKVESLSVGNRWQFDSNGYNLHYRDVERGKKFILLQTTLQNTDKSQDPDLPEIAVYEIDGKTMKRVGDVGYEFRRWSSYGSFIGLHHDFKNDFAHSSSVAFNAGAAIDEDVAKKPLAVVATGALCHVRGKRIGQPEVTYRMKHDCVSKDNLSADDFAAGPYRVIAFLNRPKGL